MPNESFEKPEEIDELAMTCCARWYGHQLQQLSVRDTREDVGMISELGPTIQKGNGQLTHIPCHYAVVNKSRNCVFTHDVACVWHNEEVRADQ